MDLCGFPKTAFYIHKAQWLEGVNTLYIAPHWNWPRDTIGKPIKVFVVSNAETVKLMLNNKVIGEQKADKYEMNTWEVPYQPGKLEAIGYKNGKEVSSYKVETTGAPVSMQLIADRSFMFGDGRDAMPVTVQALDAKGRPVPTANIPVEFELSGPGNIIGLGNGNPNSHEPEKGNKRSLYNGLAQVILQTNPDGAKPLVLTAKSPGLKPATITIAVNKKATMPFVPVVAPALIVDGWRISPVTETKPDPNQELAANDMNSWAPIRAGQLQNMASGRFVVYRASFTPFAEQQKAGGELVLKRVNGKAEVYLNKKLIATKKNAEAADLKVRIPASSGEQTLSILIESEPGQRAGLGGVVTIQ
jgi:beta-galactosidase